MSDEYDFAQLRALQAQREGAKAPQILITETHGRQRGDTVLTCEGFEIVVWWWQDQPRISFRSANPTIGSVHDVDVMIALLQRARQIMGGAS